MRRMRDVFYLNAYPENNEIVNYGMELREFLKCTPMKLNHMLLLDAEYYGPYVSAKTKLEVVDKENMHEFLKEDIYSYGNFAWVDFNQKENIEKLTPTEVAELLYIGHTSRPVHSPFFEKIDNRYVYLAHDDGYFCRLYCKYYNELEEIIANKIILTIPVSKRRKIYPVPEDVKKKLLTLAVDGLLIDFNGIQQNERSIWIPIYTIGKLLNMSEMYNNLQKYLHRSNYKAHLVHSNKTWQISSW